MYVQVGEGQRSRCHLSGVGVCLIWDGLSRLARRGGSQEGGGGSRRDEMLLVGLRQRQREGALADGREQRRKGVVGG